MGVYIKAKFSYDPDALAFIQASSIPQTSQKLAINQLVLDLKSYGIWSKMKAIYPMVGGSAFYHKWNLKDPRDLDAAFRLNFVGGWTHTAGGAKPNGTNAYADTFLVSDIMALNSIHSSFYSRTNFTDNNYKINLGYLRPTPDSYSDIALDWNGVSVFRLNNGGVYTSVSSGGNNQGFYVVSRTASNIIKAFKNGSVILNATDASNVTANNRSFYIGAGNNNGTAQYFTPNECAFVSLGDGLTDTEAVNFRTAVQAYQVALGRTVGSQTVSDADAQAFINAAVIQDQIQATAINQLVIDMKGYGLWTKMKAVYPFVGGTAASHKWNLKDPQDTNAAFRLSFVNGWTHSATGALPDGASGYADTNINVLTDLSISTNSSFGVYVAGTATAGRSHIGYLWGTNQQYYLHVDTLTEKRGYTASSVSASYYMSKTGLTSTTHRGFWAASNRSATDRAMICSDGSFLYSTLSFNVAQPSTTIYIGARRQISGSTNYDTMEHRFDFIGVGLTDTELTNLRTAATNFNTTLNRQV